VTRVAAVVIPCLNSASTLGLTLAAVNRQAGREHLRVIVADNGSTDGSLEIAGELADEVVHISARGIAPARNGGLARAREPLVLSLDSDCVPVDDRWAERHLAALAAAPDHVLATAGRTIPWPGGDHWSQRAELTPHPAFAGGRPLYAVSGNACLRTEPLRRLGGFPPYGADDAALGIIALGRGLSFLWLPDAVVQHRNPAGWRGYATQMRKVGFYAAQLRPPPERPIAWWLDRTRHVASAGRHLLAGSPREALATATSAVAQSLGARDAWRKPEVPPL
jgi:glycosyltransferase involved in cell wall biosynthesis